MRTRHRACVMFLPRFCRDSYRNLRRIKLINAFFPTATHCFIGFILGIRLDHLLGIHNPRSVRLKKRLELNILTSIDFSLNFRQGLTSNLHFRQWKLPKFETRRNVEVRIARIFVNLRQVIASSRGK